MGITRYSVPGRDISREGVSFLIGTFVYPGSTCRIKLVSEYNQAFTVDGVITRCRYLTGSTNIYDVGVKFKQSIDVAMFHRAATRLRVLLADDDPAVTRLFTHFLTGMNAELKCVTTGKEALEAAMAGQFDVILMDVDMPEMSGIEAAKALRAKGYLRPIVACSAMSLDEVKKSALEAGCTDVITKPVTRERLTKLVESLKTDPIVSTLVKDVAMAPLIDEFVAGLPEIMTKFEAAFGAGDVETIGRLARHLKGQAGSYGFDIITDSAIQLEAAARSKAEVLTLRPLLSQLASLCLAARPATCKDG